MKILRLLLFEDCNRSCEGCCNKQFDLNALPNCTDFTGWDMVLLTGGEPMLKPDVVIEAAKQVPRGTPVYVYTAKVDDLVDICRVLPFVNGFTVTLHEPKDVTPFMHLMRSVRFPRNFSLRLNAFRGVKLDFFIPSQWQVKRDIVWLAQCPLPSEETFMRFNRTEN